MTEQEKIARIRLSLSENIGPVTFKHLIKGFGSAQAAIDHFPQIIKSRHGRVISLVSMDFVEKLFLECEKHHSKIVVYGMDDYPFLLSQIDDFPPVFFATGRTDLLQKKAIGIVGSRFPTINGVNLTKKIAYDLTQNGISVVSGMAKGIDAAAHLGSLACENDSAGTIAVVATGLDVVYPKENEKLYAQLRENGCIISEYPFGTKPVPSSFPRRNRIISALSLGTLVVEATTMSGSLITAKEALNQGRDVFAVPGSPLSEKSSGTNQLIKDGAHLVLNAQDIIDALPQHTSFVLKDQNAGKQLSFVDLFSNHEEENKKLIEQVYNQLSVEATPINDIIRSTGLPSPVVNAILSILICTGEVEQFAGQRVALVYNNEWNK